MKRFDHALGVRHGTVKLTHVILMEYDLIIRFVMVIVLLSVIMGNCDQVGGGWGAVQS